MPASTHAPKRPTRANVAKLAGVSTAVVSYVLNNTGSVSEQTRSRVLDAIKLLDYQPNANARALATGSSWLLGLIVPDISNPLFAEFAVEIEAAAARRGYAILLASSEGDETIERDHITNLVGRRVDGLLLSSVSPLPAVNAAQDAGIKTVLLNALSGKPGFLTVGPDAFNGSRAATEHLIHHGHTNIGLIIGQPAGNAIEARESGWLRALLDAGLKPGPIARNDFTRAGGYAAIREMFSGRTAPTAVFISSDLQAMGALASLSDLGLHIPDDVAVISFDGSVETKYSIPALTTVRQPIHEMATTLISLVLDAATPPTHHSFQSQLIVRASCGTHAAEYRRDQD